MPTVIPVGKIEVIDFPAIKEACGIVAVGKAKRIDGDNWRVYLSGTIIRIDLLVHNEGE